jgi:LacI family transcriptional regulator
VECGTDNTFEAAQSSLCPSNYVGLLGNLWYRYQKEPMAETSADVTIKDVARQSGVSPMTVSRVINGGERVKPETRRRVEQAITELGYVPSRLARGLSRRRTGTLAVIVPDVANPFFTAVVRAAEEVARRADYRAILCDTRADLAVERDAIEELIAHRVEGTVIAPVSDRSKSHLERLARFGVPYVLVDRTVRGVEADAVVGDSEGGARGLVEHLISLGHRRIGFIVEGDEVSTARDRRRGYERALAAAEIPVDRALVVEAAVDPRGGADGMSRLLELDEPPTAVFTVNNLVAVGAIEAVRAAGLEVPEDIALVCFDDIEYASRLYPFLTAMEQPAESFGTLATQLLLERIAGRGSQRRRVVVLPPEFIIRRSCGARKAAPA